MDIEGLGERTVVQLTERELVSDVADLYRLSADDVVGLEGFAQPSAEKLIAAIDEFAASRRGEFLPDSVSNISGRRLRRH